MSAKMAQSGMASNAPWLAMRAMTEGLDASSQADGRQGMGGLHQASTSLPSSDEESASGAGSLSSVAYLTSRVKRRRSRSWASGPG